MADLLQAMDLVNRFKGTSLANQIARLEQEAEGRTKEDLPTLLDSKSVSNDLLTAAIAVKRASAQIDEIVHAVGTLLCLQEILEEGEVVQCLSLGAGNTGRSYDLETDRRVAEFTFIEWKGGSESIRKQKLFKDFYALAEAETAKRRYLYIVGDEHGPKVFSSRSTCKGMLRKFAGLQAQFVQKYGADISAREYYQQKKHLVQLVNLNTISPLAASALA